MAKQTIKEIRNNIKKPPKGFIFLCFSTLEEW
jgi:hypothetical protein